MRLYSIFKSIFQRIFRQYLTHNYCMRMSLSFIAFTVLAITLPALKLGRPVPLKTATVSQAP